VIKTPDCASGEKEVGQRLSFLWGQKEKRKMAGRWVVRGEKRGSWVNVTEKEGGRGAAIAVRVLCERRIRGSLRGNYATPRN